MLDGSRLVQGEEEKNGAPLEDEGGKKGTITSIAGVTPGLKCEKQGKPRT